MHTIIISTVSILLLSFTALAQDPSEHEYNQVNTEIQSEEELAQLLAANPDDLKANYNMASLHYNRAVSLIEKIDFNGPMDAREKTQEEITKIFEKALPYAEKAHKIDPNELNTIQMLSGIYFGINGLEMSKYYETLYLQKTGVETEPADQKK